MGLRAPTARHYVDENRHQRNCHCRRCHSRAQPRSEWIDRSNHGGRGEESARSTIEALPEVVEVIGGRIPVLVDSGFRRGTDIFKALALGANAICVGRPYAWGLAAFGQPA